MMDALSIALSGLTAQKQRIGAAASNIANMSTSGAVPGADPSAPASTVYRPLQVSMTSLGNGGVAAAVVPDENGYSVYYDPASAYADAQGFVAAPDVDLVRESVEMLMAKTAFKANLGVIRTHNEMTDSLLDILS